MNILEQLAWNYQWETDIHQAAVKNLMQHRSPKVGTILESYVTSDEPSLREHPNLEKTRLRLKSRLHRLSPPTRTS